MPHGYKQFYSSCKIERDLADLFRDVEKMFDTSNYEAERPLPMNKNKKVIR